MSGRGTGARAIGVRGRSATSSPMVTRRLRMTVLIASMRLTPWMVPASAAASYALAPAAASAKRLPRNKSGLRPFARSRAKLFSRWLAV